MSEIKISDTVAPKSDQLNAEDFLAGSRVFTITGVRPGSSPEQPVDILIQGAQPWKPCKTMRRLLLVAWGDEPDQWAGRQIELYRDDAVTYGAEKVGGIRLVAISHINSPVSAMLTVRRGKRQQFTVGVLNSAKPDTAKIIAAFEPYGITQSDLEYNIGRKADEWTAEDAKTLRTYLREQKKETTS
jgi:hypothetical protein